MDIKIKRLIYIVACLAFKNAELVNDVANEKCYIYLSGTQSNIDITYEELDILDEIEIVELDTGCDEEGFESRTYRLTEVAISKVNRLVQEELNRRKKIKKIS